MRETSSLYSPDIKIRLDRENGSNLFALVHFEYNMAFECRISTFKCHVMFEKYLDKIQAIGRSSFTLQEIMKEEHVSNNSAACGIHRLKKARKIVSPLKGLYVVVPPEHQPNGCIPAAELMPIIAEHLRAEYYVGLLSAAAFYGAAHQKTFKFQVVTNKRIRHPLEFGQVKIEIITKQILINLPVRDFTVSTGYLKVAAPELVAIDLFKYTNKAGGINNIATVLSELVESIDADQLIKLAQDINEGYQLQRIGYMLEKLNVMNEGKRDQIVSSLAQYLTNNMQAYVPLSPNMPRVGCNRCEKWKIIENTDFESDL